jgi:hypothetical protein
LRFVTESVKGSLELSMGDVGITAGFFDGNSDYRLICSFMHTPDVIALVSFGIRC